MAAVDLDAALSADSSVAAGASVSWALAAAPSANSTFTPPMLLATRAFGSAVSADSSFGPSMLRRARPMSAPVVADSTSTDAAQMSYAMAGSLQANSLGSGFMSLALPLNAGLNATAVFAPAFMNSTDGLLSFVIADSQLVADLFVSVPLAAGVAAESAFAVVSGQPDIYRLPKPNVPQPLPVPENRPLRIVPNVPNPPETGIRASTQNRRRGL